ncbi:MAG: hypothetical protein JSS21_05225 [Proteobacteria bacterium]|nr:hypothetical protein [Pseudomonadota bacterium]
MYARSIILSAISVFAFSGFAGNAHAADPACKPVFDAMVKMAGTPNHQYLSESAAYRAAPGSGEIITTSSAMYVKVSGAWHKDVYNPQQQMAEMREAATSKPMTCTHLRDEAVAGEPTALYATTEKQDDGDTVDSQLWISKSRGLPVRQTIDVDVGGKAGKSHSELRIDYKNVQAPAGS